MPFLAARLIAVALGAAMVFPAGAGAFTWGFRVYNDSSYPLVFSGVVSGDTSAPTVGSVLPPGVGYDDFEQTYYLGQTTQAEASYAVSNDRVGIGTFRTDMEIYSISDNKVYCTVDFGVCNPQGTDYVDGDTLTYLDPRKTFPPVRPRTKPTRWRNSAPTATRPPARSRRPASRRSNRRPTR
jgi:hypothetical protein